MKQLMLTLTLLLLNIAAITQTPPVRLHVQASKAELEGDGDDYATILITARDPEGEIITSMNGKVALRCSSGFLEESELQMKNGIAFTRFTAPIFGQPIKAAQRMVYFTVRFIRTFLSRFTGSTDPEVNAKLSQNIVIETFKAVNPLTLIPKKDGDNHVYFVAEMKGIKGKTKVLIQKATEGGNSALMPGYYSGYDVTGQAPFELILEGGGKGEMTQGGSEAYSVLFTSEKSAEINSAMQKMMGGGEWMNFYMGASEHDQQYMEGYYDLKKNGLPSIYLPMPENGIFLYVPPILLEYRGRLQETTQESTAVSKEAPEKRPNVYITLEQNELIGDGRTTTKAIFHYGDENKVPVAGISFTWNIPKEIKVISSQTVTDASGNAVAVIQMPLLKATEEKRGDMTGQVIDNTALFRIYTNFSTPKKAGESVYIDFPVYKTIEKKLYILKPGFETSPYKVMLPQLEFYNLESSVAAMISEDRIMQKSKLPLNDAVIFLESDNFDKAYFDRNYELYYKKDRKFFISQMERPEGGFCTVTNAEGKFKLIVRDFEGKKRLYSGVYDRTVPLDALEAKLADLTGRRTGALTEVLGLLSGGKDAAGNSDNSNTSSGEMIASLDYKTKVYKQIAEMEKVLCIGPFNEALATEEKLHILGMLMTNAKGTARFMGDTSKEIIKNGWSLLGMLKELANEEYKITDKLGKKVGFDKVAEYMAKIGMKIELGLWNKVLGSDQKNGTKRIIIEFFNNNVLASDIPNKNKASAAYYRMMGQAGEAISGAVWESLTEAITEAITDGNFIPDMLVKKFYAGLREEVDKFLEQPPAKVHEIYPQLQLALRDRSTEIRSYYQDIAASRFNTEMYKADWDLFRDVVVKGGIFVYDAKTLNWAKVKDHLEKLDNFNKKTDIAFTVTKFGQELWRFKNLWQEARGAFDFANLSIRHGIIVTYHSQTNPRFILFNSAYAAAPPVNLPVRGIADLDLSLQNGELPIDNINKALEASNDYEQWLNSNGTSMTFLTGFKPAAAGELFRSASIFDAQLTMLIVSAFAYTQDQSSSGQQDYEASAANLEKSAKEFLQAVATATAEIKELPKEIRIQLPEVPGGAEPVWNDPLYQKIGLGVIVLLMFGVVTVIIIRRKRRKLPELQQPEKTFGAMRPSIRQNTTSTTRPYGQLTMKETTSGTTPKFCTQCGAPLNPGAKFCGKCGNKII